jgi:hypothetical protein
MSTRRRIGALEVAHRRRAAVAMAQPGLTVDAILDQGIRFLTMPPARQREDYPHYTNAEPAERQSWLPAIRRARLAGHG